MARTAGSKPKVVILCGGIGTRLKEETEFRPKPLVRIGTMPILWHIMKIYSHYGFNEFILCLGYKGEMIKNYFLNFEELSNDFSLNLRSKDEKITHRRAEALENWKITFVDTGQESQTGTRIHRIKEYVEDDDEFFLTYGDGVADINILELLKHHRKMNKSITVSGVHPISVFGLIEYKDGLVKTFREKPRIDDVISGGFFVCTPKIFKYLNDSDDCIFENKPLKTLAKKKELSLYRHEDFWYCMDTHKHVDELNKLWNSKKAPWKIW